MSLKVKHNFFMTERERKREKETEERPNGIDKTSHRNILTIFVNIHL